VGRGGSNNVYGSIFSLGFSPSGGQIPGIFLLPSLPIGTVYTPIAGPVLSSFFPHPPDPLDSPPNLEPVVFEKDSRFYLQPPLFFPSLALNSLPSEVPLFVSLPLSAAFINTEHQGPSPAAASNFPLTPPHPAPKSSDSRTIGLARVIGAIRVHFLFSD